ncbi:unnamed protein product [Adineta steineri]|uniref:Uncharacterized protein n=1 Tax=Adineta steineri TaxID=433720 RepID=A0A814K9Q3_9BILA|nr:unnamed protein product [Adineta steineri]CAF3501807.1 unnamed protein product [Adineta steineri]
MNPLASILYSSSPVNTKKRKNLSFQSSVKPLSTKTSQCQIGMLFRSSTPKTSLQTGIKPTITAHPTTLSFSSPSKSFSMNSPQSPRCSTPLFAKQRRTRPFIACELCRQRAFQSINSDENKTKDNEIEKKNSKQQQHHHHHSTTLQYYQYQTNTSIIRRRRRRQRSSMDQLLVWIV